MTPGLWIIDSTLGVDIDVVGDVLVDFEVNGDVEVVTFDHVQVAGSDQEILVRKECSG